jgi:AraC-like DNA-binding protein
MAELQRILPNRLYPFAEAIVRNPSKGSIATITRHLGVHRQTPNFWCRKERYLRPEELLVWCRMLLAAALLELTGRTLDSIAIELDYASSTSLRNQLKNNTGMTATQIRVAGFGRIIDLFVGRVAQVQSGFAGIREEPSTKSIGRNRRIG